MIVEWRAEMLFVAKQIKLQMIYRGYANIGYILKFNKSHVQMYGPCPEQLPTARNDNDSI